MIPKPDFQSGTQTRTPSGGKFEAGAARVFGFAFSVRCSIQPRAHVLVQVLSPGWKAGVVRCRAAKCSDSRECIRLENVSFKEVALHDFNQNTATSLDCRLPRSLHAAAIWTSFSSQLRSAVTRASCL